MGILIYTVILIPACEPRVVGDIENDMFQDSNEFEYMNCIDITQKLEICNGMDPINPKFNYP